jgi:hypothetical protein
MYYPSYDAAWFQPWKFFDSLTDIDSESMNPCEDTRMTDTTELETYVKVTGDSEGVTKSPDGALSHRCWGRWWLSPACRAQPSTCIPVVSGGTGWGIHDFQHKATAFNMPLAIGVSKQYEELARKHRILLYYYTPNDKLADGAPKRIVFPDYDPAKWLSGDRTTMTPETKLSKWVNNQLSTVAPNVYDLAKNMLLTLDIVNGVILDKRNNNEATIEAAACRWVRNNSNVWRDWIPNAKLCRPGQGLSKSLSFVDDFNKADGCTWCVQGRYSAKFEYTSDSGSVHTRICKLCPRGKFSDAIGLKECKDAPLGHYVPEQGSASAIQCNVGTYASESGQQSCTPCSDFQSKPDELGKAISPKTTHILAATSVDLCLCPPDSFPKMGGCARCLDFRGLQCQETHGMSNPMLLEGYMSHSEDSNSVAV